jgi:hypothetical protein
MHFEVKDFDGCGMRSGIVKGVFKFKFYHLTLTVPLLRCYSILRRFPVSYFLIKNVKSKVCFMIKKRLEEIFIVPHLIISKNASLKKRNILI